MKKEAAAASQPKIKEKGKTNRMGNRNFWPISYILGPVF